MDGVEALRNADRPRPFVRWIRTTGETHVRAGESEHVRRRRR